MASNKHVVLRKIENFVRSKGKTANFRKPVKKFKIVDEILAYKRKRWVIFDNDRKNLNHNTTLFYCYSSTHLRHLSCRESKPFKWFNIKISYSFLFTRKFMEHLFSKGVLICQEKNNYQEFYFLGNYDRRIAYIQGDTGTVFKEQRPSCKKKEFHVNSTSNTFQRKYENFD